jgi:protein-tyrosine phosphatase
MPLTTSLTSMNVIEKFIRNSEHNYIFVHCQENKSRSILFLAAYMYWSGKISDVASALAYVN